jgi:hypothetical protein
LVGLRAAVPVAPPPRAVETGDGRTDVLLIPEQPPRDGVGVGGSRDGGDDVLACPDDVVGPELAKGKADRFG